MSQMRSKWLRFQSPQAQPLCYAVPVPLEMQEECPPLSEGGAQYPEAEAVLGDLYSLLRAGMLRTAKARKEILLPA